MGDSLPAGGNITGRVLGRVCRLLFLQGAGKGAQGKALGDGIVPRAAKGLTPRQSADGQQAPPNGSEAPQRRDRVAGAGGGKPASGRDKGGDALLIDPDGQDQKLAAYFFEELPQPLHGVSVSPFGAPHRAVIWRSINSCTGCILQWAVRLRATKMKS